MAKIVLYNQEGKTAGNLELPKALFEVEPNLELVHQAVVTQTANTRQVLAHAKDRSEVRGGGKKPWRQKGTGRARHGSIRSPIWTGGGVTFGPTKNRNFSKKMNRRSRRKALAMVLTDKLASEKFVAIDSLVLPEAKTKAVAGILSKLPVAGKKTLVILEPENKDFVRAANNLPKTTTISAKSLNIVDIISHDFVLASKAAIDSMAKTYAQE